MKAANIAAKIILKLTFKKLILIIIKWVLQLLLIQISQMTEIKHFRLLGLDNSYLCLHTKQWKTFTNS